MNSGKAGLGRAGALSPALTAPRPDTHHLCGGRKPLGPCQTPPDLTSPRILEGPGGQCLEFSGAWGLVLGV